MRAPTIFDLREVKRDNGYLYNFELIHRLNYGKNVVKKERFISDKLLEIYPNLKIETIKQLYQKPHLEVTFTTKDKAFICEFRVPF